MATEWKASPMDITIAIAKSPVLVAERVVA